MVDPNGQTLTRITHPFTGGEVAAAVLPVYAFKFKSTGNVAFNCQVKICREGEDCVPVCSCLDHSSCFSIMLLLISYPKGENCKLKFYYFRDVEKVRQFPMMV